AGSSSSAPAGWRGSLNHGDHGDPRRRWNAARPPSISVISVVIPGPRSCRTIRVLDPLDLEDLVGSDAAGGVDLDHVADLLADHRPGDRGGDGDLARAHVGLVLADDLVARLFLGVLVEQAYGGPEL